MYVLGTVVFPLCTSGSHVYINPDGLQSNLGRLRLKRESWVRPTKVRPTKLLLGGVTTHTPLLE